MRTHISIQSKRQQEQSAAIDSKQHATQKEKEKKMKTQVENMISHNGNAIPNQFEITTPKGVFFQSYRTVIAFKPNDGRKIQLDRKAWDYSVTTGKYRNIFLGERKADTERKIKSGEYELADLN
jgi:hypothetical protein